MQDSSAGALAVVEDFQPISDNRALITAGSNLRDLHTLGECDYRFDHERLVLTNLDVLRRGTYLRLGNVHDGQLIYSDGWQCPHQPFKSDKHFYYSYGAPKATIYRDGLPFIVPEMLFFVECGKAFEHDGYVYFEANKIPESPDTWEIWRLKGADFPEFVAMGANPAIYNGTLYFDRWNHRGGFDVVTRPL